MTKPSEGYDKLEELGLLDYGSNIEGRVFREAFDIDDIEYPAMKSEIDAQSLELLAASDYVRNKLLNHGKYLKGVRDGYRVLLPSENAGQVMSYVNSASTKLKRGQKLDKNTPAEYQIHSNDKVRMMMKMEDAKDTQ